MKYKTGQTVVHKTPIDSNPMNLQTKLQASIRSYFDNQLSPETRRAYKTDLEHFAARTHRIPLNQITQTHVIEYREYLLGSFKPATAVRRLAAVRGFFKHLTASGLLSVDPTAGVKMPRKPDNANTEALTDAEVVSMLQSCDDTRFGRWEYALVSVLAYLGLRRAEVCSLTIDALGSDRGIQTLKVIGKGSKERILPIPEHLGNALLAIRNTSRAHINRKQLLVRPDGKALKPDHIYYIVKKIAQRCNISKTITPHSFRATFVSNAIDNGCNPMQVQYACGWSDTKQINRYDKRRSEIHQSAVWKVKYDAA